MSEACRRDAVSRVRPRSVGPRRRRDRLRSSRDGAVELVMDLPSPLDTLSPEEQRIVRENLRPVTFTAGQCIFRAGDAGDGCYLIESGEVRLELVREHVDTDSVLGFIGLGSILGELALLDGLPRSVTAYAETPVVAAHLPAGAITAICDQRPVIGTGIVRAL